MQDERRMKMTKKEREEIKREIAYRDVMTRKLIKIAKTTFLFFLLFSAIAIWGFTGLHDNFLLMAEGIRNVLKWIGLIGAIIAGLLTIMFYMSYHNSKKYVFALIDKVQNKN